MVNRLAKEGSPYLLEHADNPVDWFPWSEEAFEKAKIEKKLIFVSIGYSACHWCHVMRRESFEDPNTAEFMNTHFVNIKLDREERPDIDHQLQITHQLLNGRSGGWPLSIWMTANKKPFYSGTYFPKSPKYGMPSFLQVLEAVLEAKEKRFDQLQKQAQSLENHLIKINDHVHPDSELGTINSKDLIDELIEDYDPTYGGFGSQPKFPNETRLLLLIHEAARYNHEEGIKTAEKTVESMINGGIYDHLGGGFHRYSVDKYWLVPHFEKMLYNQALMILVLTELYRITKKPLFKQTIKETIDYVLREMIDSETGAFYSSQNADSEGIEGKFYVWSFDEVKTILGNQKQFEIFSSYYKLKPEGNWESTNILHTDRDYETILKKTKLSKPEIEEQLAHAKEKLFEVRNKRIWPSTDSKIITSWNGLMLTAIIKASTLFVGEKTYDIYVKAVENALSFFKKEMITDDNVFRIHVQGNRKINGFLDDFQYLIEAYLEYFQLTSQVKYLDMAKILFDKSISLFMNRESGAVSFSSELHDTIISSYSDTFDSPLPSALGITTQNALKISMLFEDDEQVFHEISKTILRRHQHSTANAHPSSISTFLYSQILYQNHFHEIIYVEKRNNKEFLLQLNEHFIPFRFQFRINEARDIKFPWIQSKLIESPENYIIICRNFVCSLPLYTFDEVHQYLSQD